MLCGRQMSTGTLLLAGTPPWKLLKKEFIQLVGQSAAADCGPDNCVRSVKDLTYKKLRQVREGPDKAV